MVSHHSVLRISTAWNHIKNIKPRKTTPSSTILTLIKVLRVYCWESGRCTLNYAHSPFNPVFVNKFCSVSFLVHMNYFTRGNIIFVIKVDKLNLNLKTKLRTFPMGNPSSHIKIFGKSNPGGSELWSNKQTNRKTNRDYYFIYGYILEGF